MTPSILFGLKTRINWMFGYRITPLWYSRCPRGCSERFPTPVYFNTLLQTLIQRSLHHPSPFIPPHNVLQQISHYLYYLIIITTYYLKMYYSNTLKILVIGPEGSGKTAITNFLCGKSNVLDVPYRPTAGLRIVETQKEIKNKNYTIEMWDVSGSSRYDRGWAAIQKGAHGVIGVYNPDNSKSETEFESWIEKFPKSINMPTAQCVGFAHHLSEKNRDKKSKAPKGVGNMTIVDTSIEDGTSTLLPAFDSFLSSVIASLEKKRANDETNLMNE